MNGAMATLSGLIGILSMLFFYGMMGIVILLLYRLQKDMADVKRSIFDLQETVALAQLPREPRPDRPDAL